MRRRNFYVGKQPDLFGGESPQFVPLSELSSEQIRKLPRTAFSEDEWDELSYEDAEAIYEKDPESKKVVDRLAKELTRHLSWTIGADNVPWQEASDYMEGWFDAFIADRADDLADIADREGYSEVDEMRAEHPGYTYEQIDTAINAALADTNNYDYRWSNHREGLYSVEYQPTLYVEGLEMVSWFDGTRIPFEDEVERAVERANEDHYYDWDADQVWDMISKPTTKGGYYKTYESGPLDTDYYAVAEPIWSTIRADVEADLENRPRQAVVEVLEQTPDEDRIVCRFDDGSYVLQLAASQMPAEGRAMRHCIGKRQHKYIGNVEQGYAEAYSLRTSGGRPKFTIYVEDGIVEQVKGKSNRLPGWDLGKVGTSKFKPTEVEHLKSCLQQMGHDPWNVSDMVPGLEGLEGQTPSRRTNPAVHCGFCARANPDWPAADIFRHSKYGAPEPTTVTLKKGTRLVSLVSQSDLVCPQQARRPVLRHLRSKRHAGADSSRKQAQCAGHAAVLARRAGSRSATKRVVLGQTHLRHVVLHRRIRASSRSIQRSLQTQRAGWHLHRSRGLWAHRDHDLRCQKNCRPPCLGRGPGAGLPALDDVEAV